MIYMGVVTHSFTPHTSSFILPPPPLPQVVLASSLLASPIVLHLLLASFSTCLSFPQARPVLSEDRRHERVTQLIRVSRLEVAGVSIAPGE